MLYRKLPTLLLVSGLLFITCKNRDIDTANQFYPDILPLQDYHGATVGMMSLPMNRLPLEDLDAFESPSPNWQIASNATADYQAERYVRYQSDDAMEISNGTGVLVNRPTEENRRDIYTKLGHGDIELKVEFLVPRGSNSGIYFQGRYELQIVDSWGVEEPTYGSLGGIYQRWDELRPEGEQGYEGAAPMVNASLAPGLWQEFHVLFRAPRFDENGNKVRNAKFEKVFLNGKLIHENVELSGPTRGPMSAEEAPYGPLRIQGSHGPVAFRNIEYKKYSRSDSLRLGPLHYKIFDYTGARLPEREVFDRFPVLEEGSTDSLNVGQLSPRNNWYASWFSGELEVPVSGEYLFQTMIGTGGNLYINGELITTSTGRTYLTLVGRKVHLEAGTHQLDISHFKRRFVNPIVLIYEGPGMERRTLASREFDSGSEPEWPEVLPPLSDEPEVYSGFIRYGEGKRTHISSLGMLTEEYAGFADPETWNKRLHVVSVADPSGLHYSYDLAKPSLLQFWRDPFANVSTVWFGRGQVLLNPLGTTVEKQTEIPVGRLQGNQLRLYQDEPGQRGLQVPDGLGVREYNLNEANRPVFRFEVDGVTIQDEIFPSENERDLVRELRYETDADKTDLVAILAQGERIERLSNGYYRVRNYYISVDDSNGEEPSIQEWDGKHALVVPILRGSSRAEISYRIVW